MFPNRPRSRAPCTGPRAQAVAAAYREALKEWTRDRASLNWALAQNNLGNALKEFGEREIGAVVGGLGGAPLCSKTSRKEFV